MHVYFLNSSLVFGLIMCNFGLAYPVSELPFCLWLLEIDVKGFRRSMQMIRAKKLISSQLVQIIGS